ncbi:c-type cytochrome biogenesis protein CcmI [Roseomonas sp. SSH11]|uniref:C-type cytochrome biogenesis protein CcmI n=1 Tax=Pararoseomonas baculiformis TaxID=2820812 RepID=A0ABS4AIU6_9PROT|nr:c-type cytochrome biogenesis protein CcmI [Pararoseomonas baculiformis]
MTWLLAAILALAALLPLALVAWRPAPVTDRGAADRALYRAQLAELERDREMGRLDEAAHAAARLEVQRRLLAVPDAAPARMGGRGPVVAGLLAVPVLAFALYFLNGLPGMPSATFTARQEVAQRDEALLAQLRARLAALPAGNPAARQGWLLLAEAERNRGRAAESAAAYAEVLKTGFEADIAAQRAQVLLEAGLVEEASAFLAEVLPRAPDHVGLRFLSGLAEAQAGRPSVARATWAALLASAPEGAPWRGMVERRMQALP